MNDEPTGQRRPGEQRELKAGREERREEPQRRPGLTERDEWRGTGVCGDRHTD